MLEINKKKKRRRAKAKHELSALCSPHEMEHGRRVLRANSSSELTARSTWRARSWSVGSRLEPSQYVLSFAMERIIYK